MTNKIINIMKFTTQLFLIESANRYFHFILSTYISMQNKDLKRKESKFTTAH